MMEFWFEDGLMPDEVTYHSKRYKNLRLCKNEALEYCKRKQKDVKLFFINNMIGSTCGTYLYNKGFPVFEK